MSLAADVFAAGLCEYMAVQGYSVLLLGPCGVGKSTAQAMVRADLAHLVAAWNDLSGRVPPPTGKVAYVLLSRPVGVSLHYELPVLDGGLEEAVRGCVHPAWLAP